jgi:hypothetical protein
MGGAGLGWVGLRKVRLGKLSLGWVLFCFVWFGLISLYAFFNLVLLCCFSPFSSFRILSFELLLYYFELVFLTFFSLWFFHFGF